MSPTVKAALSMMGTLTSFIALALGGLVIFAGTFLNIVKDSGRA